MLMCSKQVFFPYANTKSYVHMQLLTTFEKPTWTIQNCDLDITVSNNAQNGVIHIVCSYKKAKDIEL